MYYSDLFFNGSEKLKQDFIKLVRENCVNIEYNYHYDLESLFKTSYALLLRLDEKNVNLDYLKRYNNNITYTIMFLFDYTLCKDSLNLITEYLNLLPLNIKANEWINKKNNIVNYFLNKNDIFNHKNLLNNQKKILKLYKNEKDKEILKLKLNKIKITDNEKSEIKGLFFAAQAYNDPRAYHDLDSFFNSVKNITKEPINYAKLAEEYLNYLKS